MVHGPVGSCTGVWSRAGGRAVEERVEMAIPRSTPNAPEGPLTHPRPNPSPTAPPWPHCGHGSSEQDPVGCRGAHVPGHTACLTHLTRADRRAHLDDPGPRADLDLRGTTFEDRLWESLLDVLRDSHTGGEPVIGSARFTSAVFECHAWFDSMAFDGNAVSDAATFRDASFEGAVSFEGVAFQEATFDDPGQLPLPTDSPGPSRRLTGPCP